jgi:hypothetical protein
MRKIALTVVEVLLLSLLFCWLIINDYNYQLQRESIQKTIDEYIVYLFVPNNKVMNELENELKEKGYVRELKASKNTEVVKQMVDNYDLANLSQTVNITSLPNLIEFKLDSALIDTIKFRELSDFLQEKEKLFTYYLPKEEIEQSLVLNVKTAGFRWIYRIGGLLITLILSYYVKILWIKRYVDTTDDEKPLLKEKKKITQFWIHAVMLSIIPALLLSLIWYITMRYGLHSYLLKPIELLVLVAAVFSGCVMSWLSISRPDK